MTGSVNGQKVAMQARQARLSVQMDVQPSSSKRLPSSHSSPGSGVPLPHRDEVPESCKPESGAPVPAAPAADVVPPDPPDPPAAIVPPAAVVPPVETEP